MSSSTVTNLLTTKTPEILNSVLDSLRLYPALDVVGAGVLTWALLRLIRTSRQRLRTTELNGPPSENFIFGIGDKIFDSKHPGDIYEAWAQQYGPVFQVPSTLGGKKVVLCDPKAVAHFFSKETWTYLQTPVAQKALEDISGRGLLWAHGESHKRQRRSLTPAFSIAAIRQMTSIFYDSAYKAKSAWDGLIESAGRDDAVIDIQNWMNHISLDTIGLAGFSHNFGALEGKDASVTEIFDTFGASPRSSAPNKLSILLAEKFPFLIRFPTSRVRLVRRLNSAMGEISDVLLARTKKELEMGMTGVKEEKSIIGLLIKGGSGASDFPLTKDEIMAQMKLLIIAGYETTSISLTWALLELSRNPDFQTKLRNELLEHGADPTYDQLTNTLPYLNAVVHETLRLHPPVVEITRMAGEDDIIPLSEPIRAKSGEMVDSLTITKGTRVTVSVESINRSTAIWGDDAKVFQPDRWLEDASGQSGIPAKAKEVHGHHHLLTFSDGPRICLGKNFAVAEFKAVLTVLVKNFVFELRDGADTKIEIGRGVLFRPKVADEVGCKLPLRVRQYVA